MQLFDIPELTEQQEDLIKEVFANPTVKHYLQLLASRVAVDMVTAINDPAIDAEAYLRAQFLGKGSLSILETLLATQQIAASSTLQE